MTQFLSLIALISALAIYIPASSLAQGSDANGIPFEWAPWKDPENPDKMVYTESKNDLFTRRDTSKDSGREPGLFYPNRYELGPLWNAIPTFMGAPIAITPQDLTAGEHVVERLYDVGLSFVEDLGELDGGHGPVCTAERLHDLGMQQFGAVGFAAAGR